MLVFPAAWTIYRRDTSGREENLSQAHTSPMEDFPSIIVLVKKDFGLRKQT